MMLDLSQRLIVIVGGGGVAARKARGVLAAGAQRVRCIAPEFRSEMPAEVERVAEAFAPRHLDGAGLVFAATDSPQVNEQVVREAHRRGLLVNRADADEDQPGDFATPALWNSGSVSVAISAGGSPALAAAIRDDLANKIDPLHVAMADAMQVLRPMIRDSLLSIDDRRRLFRELAGPEAMGILGQGGLEGLRRWLVGRYQLAPNPIGP